MPGHVAAPPYASLLSGKKTLAEYSAEAPRRVDPVFDDSPFYFAIEKPWGMPYLMRQGLLALVEPVGVMLVLFVAFGKPRGEAVAPYASSVVYFASLGAGFIAVELTLLQNLTLLVGHPIFTLSVLLFTLLATSGLGSSLSKRVPTVWACCHGRGAWHGRRVRAARTSCRSCCRSARPRASPSPCSASRRSAC